MEKCPAGFPARHRALWERSVVHNQVTDHHEQIVQLSQKAKHLVSPFANPLQPYLQSITLPHERQGWQGQVGVYQEVRFRPLPGYRQEGFLFDSNSSPMPTIQKVGKITLTTKLDEFLI